MSINEVNKLLEENDCCSYRANKSILSRLRSYSRKRPLLVWLLPLIGFMSLIWFLIRVIPKPSRASYPCQRMAAPLASGFVVWLTALVGSSLFYRKARSLIRKSRYFLAGIFLTLALGIIFSTIFLTDDNKAAAAFTPSEPGNKPMGIARGINPGRVVWIRDADATSWDGTNGDWWDNINTNQSRVDSMVSKSIKRLTGQSSDSQAWDSLFRHFNKTKGSGDSGYIKGEKIAIKINANQDKFGQWRKGQGMPSPHVIFAVVNQLINTAGVPGEDITIYDATQRRNVGDPIYNRIKAGSDSNFQAIRFVAGLQPSPAGRIVPVFDMANPVKFSGASLPDAYLPKCVTGAKYLINLALLRPHTMCGVTLTAKNHYGSVYFSNAGGWVPRVLHTSSSARNPMGTFNNLVDLIGHRHLGGKTLLYIVDGLYTAFHNEGDVFRFESLGDDWASSLLVSQDPVAIDSVGLDILRNEPKATRVTGNVDNYMHEAAMANNPPSGTQYDPEGDGTVLESLGVHEHWNNPIDRKYSRNLGTGDGIELIIMN